MKLDRLNIKTGIEVVTLILAFLLPLILEINQYLLTVLILMLVFTMYSSAWNLLATSGQGSLGHAAFFGIGGYVSAIISNSLGLPVILTIIIGGFFAAAIGVLIGLYLCKVEGVVPRNGAQSIFLVC